MRGKHKIIGLVKFFFRSKWGEEFEIDHYNFSNWQALSIYLSITQSFIITKSIETICILNMGNWHHKCSLNTFLITACNLYVRQIFVFRSRGVGVNTKYEIEYRQNFQQHFDNWLVELIIKWLSSVKSTFFNHFYWRPHTIKAR